MQIYTAKDILTAKSLYGTIISKITTFDKVSRMAVNISKSETKYEHCVFEKLMAAVIWYNKYINSFINSFHVFDLPAAAQK